MTITWKTRNRDPLPPAVERELAARLAAVDWLAIAQQEPEDDPVADAEFAEWNAATIARADYARAVAAWLRGHGPPNETMTVIGGSAWGGMYLDPGAARRLSDAALLGSGWRIYAVAVIGPAGAWGGPEITAVYVEPAA